MQLFCFAKSNLHSNSAPLTENPAQVQWKLNSVQIICQIQWPPADTIYSMKFVTV